MGDGWQECGSEQEQEQKSEQDACTCGCAERIADLEHDLEWLQEHADHMAYHIHEQMKLYHPLQRPAWLDDVCAATILIQYRPSDIRGRRHTNGT